MATLKLLLAFLGTGTVSYLMFYFLLKQDNKNSIAVIEGKDKEGMKRLKSDLKQQSWTIQNVLMSKWMSFGGGFYGVMAVLTYVIVEFFEVVDFLTSESSLIETIKALSVGDFVDLFINSIMNFVTAITWPVYWMRSVEGYATWIWFVVVYFGYSCGQYFAKNTVSQQSE